MPRYVITVDAGYGNEHEIVEALDEAEAETIASETWIERVQDVGGWWVEEITEDTDLEEYEL